MKGLPELGKEYFERFNTKPVDIKPFDPKSLGIAHKYKKRLDDLLRPFGQEAVLRGSTYFKISGKGEIEFGVYPSEENWQSVISALTDYYKGNLGKLETDYARFNDKFEGYDVEVTVMKGRSALVDKKLTLCLAQSPSLLKEYEGIKREYAYSKREYYIQKDKFFRKVIETIPEED